MIISSSVPMPLASVCLVCLTLPLSVVLFAVCLSVTPDCPSLTHSSHPSYNIKPLSQWKNAGHGASQPTRAPVGQSISSIKDMLSTRVCPPGPDHLSAPPVLPQLTQGPWVKCTQSPSCFISMAPRHPACC